MTGTKRTLEVRKHVVEAAAHEPQGRKHGGRREMVEGLASDDRAALLRLRSILDGALDGRQKATLEDMELLRGVGSIFGVRLYRDGRRAADEPAPIPEGAAERMGREEKEGIKAALRKEDTLSRIQFLDEDVQRYCRRFRAAILSAIPYEKQGVCYEEMENCRGAARAFERAAAQAEGREPQRAAMLYERSFMNNLAYGDCDGIARVANKGALLNPALARVFADEILHLKKIFVADLHKVARELLAGAAARETDPRKKAGLLVREGKIFEISIDVERTTRRAFRMTLEAAGCYERAAMFAKNAGYAAMAKRLLEDADRLRKQGTVFV